LRVDDKVHIIKGTIAQEEINTYVLIDGGEACLIDLGTAAVPGTKILDFLSSQRMKNIQPLYAVVTHAHQDHVGLGAAVRKRTKAKIAIHLNDAAWFEDHELQYRETLCRFTSPSAESKMAFLSNVGESTKADIILRDGDLLKIGATYLKVIHTPGHTPGSICLYEENSRMLFSGDLLQHTKAFLDLTKWFGLIVDAKDYLDSLDNIQALGPKTILPGHFSVIEGSAVDSEIELCRETYRMIERNVTELIETHGSLNLDRIDHLVSGKLGLDADREFRLTTIQAVLRRLVDEGKLKETTRWYQ
jgi:glyoxylase-like metal-dependent hydrolase (beta-lactamase superfamily II)